MSVVDNFNVNKSFEDLKIDSELRDWLTPLSSDELKVLEESLLREGCRDPLVVWNGILVDGHNRFEICVRNSIPFKTVEAKELKSKSHVKEWMFNNQVGKRNLTTAQKALMAIKLEPVYAELARERQACGQGGVLLKQKKENNKGNGDRLLSPDLGQANSIERGKALEQAAKKVGLGAETVRKMKKILESAPKELKQQVLESKVAIDNACRQIQRQERQETLKATKFPEGKYRVLYADPPWRYSDQLPPSYGGAEDQYPTMSISELCDMPIADITDDNAVLFMWTTSPLLEDCFKVINAWGFKYKTSFVWDKVKHNLGHYNSVRHEFLLLATKGSCVPDNVKLFDSVQVVERTGKHSEKPELFRGIIETLYKCGNKLELFARKPVTGWEVYGNEI